MHTYIFRYYGEEAVLRYSYPSLTFEFLLCNYGIVTGEKTDILALSDYPMITYLEEASLFTFENYNSRNAACQNTSSVTNQTNLTGKGVLVAIIDSGIDYLHPDFIEEDGTSRILELWDQGLGQIYTQTTLTQAISSDYKTRQALVPSMDLSGHGTHVAGSAAGNGRASMGTMKGMAPDATLLIVKLAPSVGGLYPSSAELMRAVDYCVRKALLLQMPIVINLSYGNSIGPHTGDTLLEAYLNAVSELGRCSIVVGTGNEGAEAGHAALTLTSNTTTTLEFSIEEYVPSLLVSLWKSPLDTFTISLLPPGEGSYIPLFAKSNLFSVAYRPILPYSSHEEIAILLGRKGNNDESFPTEDAYILPGIWRLRITTETIKNGIVELWLPSTGTIGRGARFLTPSSDFTLTIPSTASRVISVGAYDAYQIIPSSFSGRGIKPTQADTASRVSAENLYFHCTKPDLVAPGVNINSCSPGGGYAIRSGTSMATPFVTGAAACLMQWGIIEKNHPTLYGNVLKAALCAGAVPLPGTATTPNNITGWGALCLRNSVGFLEKNY